MAASKGFVASEGDVEGRRDSGDTAEVKTVIDAAAGCEHLEQRVIRFAPGRSRERSNEGRQEVLYVASGSGTLRLDDEDYALEPDSGIFVAPGERYTVDNTSNEELVAISVTAPASENGVGASRKVVVRYADQEPLPASPNREFRYLINQEAGCLDVTQFVGVIPPGRAPLHSHTYDEVVYVIEGEGVIHIGDTETRLMPGTCVHLPPLLMHCLENSGDRNMRVLGVFHPSGDPASRADPDNKGGAYDVK